MISVEIKDPIFEVGSTVIVLKPMMKRDPSFDRDKISKTGTVRTVREEGLLPIKIVTVVFKDGNVGDFYPEELNVTLL